MSRSAIGSHSWRPPTTRGAVPGPARRRLRRPHATQHLPSPARGQHAAVGQRGGRGVRPAPHRGARPPREARRAGARLHRDAPACRRRPAGQDLRRHRRPSRDHAAAAPLRASGAAAPHVIDENCRRSPSRRRPRPGPRLRRGDAPRSTAATAAAARAGGRHGLDGRGRLRRDARRQRPAVIVVEVHNCVYRELSQEYPDVVCAFDRGMLCGMLGAVQSQHAAQALARRRVLPARVPALRRPRRLERQAPAVVLHAADVSPCTDRRMSSACRKRCGNVSSMALTSSSLLTASSRQVHLRGAQVLSQLIRGSRAEDRDDRGWSSRQQPCDGHRRGSFVQLRGYLLELRRDAQGPVGQAVGPRSAGGFATRGGADRSYLPLSTPLPSGPHGATARSRARAMGRSSSSGVRCTRL